MPIGSRFLVKHLPTRLTTAVPPGNLPRNHGTYVLSRRPFSFSTPALSVMSALSRKVKADVGDISVPPPTIADSIGAHEQSEHAVISAFDLFSIGGLSCCL